MASTSCRFTASKSILLLLFLVYLNIITSSVDGRSSGYWTVYQTNGQFFMKQGRDPQGAAFGRFVDTLDSNGWTNLWVSGGLNKSVSDEARAYAAGFLEGALTHQRIWEYRANILQLASNYLYPGNPVQTEAALMAWLGKQQQWVDQQVKQKGNTDKVWRHIGLVSQQVRGMADGYNSVAPSNQVLTLADFVYINSFPDSLDIVNVVTPENRIDWNSLKPEEAIRLWTQRSHCSSLVKVHRNKDGKLEVFSGHTTWIFFSMMNRVFKHFDLGFFADPQMNSKISFSSYPGQIVSADDYYVIGDNAMVVMETSNSIFNSDLYKDVVPASLLSWQRTALANRLAKGGKEWVDLFKVYNSGTYNNQWIIVDHSKVTSNQQLQNDFLWIAEQIPGKVEGADLTEWVRKNSYWASYNIPYFKDIYDLSGYASLDNDTHGAFSWSQCPRAEIFRRNQTLVTSVTDMQHLMRYNNYQHDPLSSGQPDNAISARSDLDSNRPTPFGGIDSKINSNLFGSRVATIAQSSPTHDQQAAFQWNDQFASWPHLGQPKEWNFGWIPIDSKN